MKNNRNIKYKSIYLPTEDITIIFRFEKLPSNEIKETLTGFYYGEPKEELTEEFKHSNYAIFEDFNIFDKI